MFKRMFNRNKTALSANQKYELDKLQQELDKNATLTLESKFLAARDCNKERFVRNAKSVVISVGIGTIVGGGVMLANKYISK